MAGLISHDNPCQAYGFIIEHVVFRTQHALMTPAQFMIVQAARISDVCGKASASIQILLAAMHTSTLTTLLPQWPARFIRRTASLPKLTARCGDETMHLRFAPLPPQ